MKLQPIVLAAGKGTRMQSESPKSLFKINGKSMLTWILESIQETDNSETPLIVVGYGAEQIKSEYGPRYQYVLQLDINGTAAAVKECLPYLDTEKHNPALILYGDHPFITSESINKIHKIFFEKKPKLAMFTTSLPDYDDWRVTFKSFGRVVRNREGNIERIAEYKNASEAEKQILEVNPGIYCVDTNWLKDSLPKIDADAITGEYYLTDLLEIAKLAGDDVITVSLSPEEAVGINSVKDAEKAERRLQ